MASRSVAERPARFGAKIEVVECGCWLWTASDNGCGYGQFSVDGKMVYAHVWSFEFFGGVIPEGHQIDHVRARGCLHTLCVNPAHLEAVTQKENMLRGTCRAAVNAAKTHCLRGHRLPPYVTGRKRKCAECWPPAPLQRHSAPVPDATPSVLLGCQLGARQPETAADLPVCPV